MTGEVKPGGGTHTRYCYLIRKRKPGSTDPKCPVCHPPGSAPAQPAAPPPTATTDRDKLIAEITGAGIPKPNTGAGTGAAPPAPAPAGGAGVTGMFVTGGLFRFIGARLNKLFDTEDFSLTHEEADALADSFSAAIGTSGKPMNPWIAFAVMLACWLIIPLIEHAPKLIAKYSKKEKDEHGNPIKKPTGGGFLGLHLRRPEPAPAVAYEPRPGAGVAAGVAG